MNPIDTVEKARQAGIYDAQYGLGAYKAKPITTPIAPITPQDIQTPQAPINLPAQTTPTGATGLLGMVEANTTQNLATEAIKETSELYDQKAIDQGKQDKGSVRDMVIRLLSGKKGETALTDEAYTETVDPAKQELTDINNQINARQLALRREIEAEQSKGGRTTQGTQDAINIKQRQAASELADLSVIQQAKSNNYANAKEIADRKVAMQMEEQKNKYDTAMFIYGEIKEDLTKEEDKKFQVVWGEFQRKMEREENEKKAVNDIALNALQNGAPVSIAQKMMNAKTQTEAVQLGGQFVNALDIALKRADLANTYSMINDRNNKAVEVKPPTAGQEQLAGFATRVTQANDIFEKTEQEIAKLNTAQQIIQRKSPNFAKSPTFQSQEQAERNFINAILRRESGAAISPTEFDSAAKQYFPQPGDSKEVLLQKKQNRQTVQASLIQGSGSAYTPPVTLNGQASQADIDYVNSLPK